MPNKKSGLWRNKNAPMSKNYRKGGKFSYNVGGGTEVGKEASSYKEYVKKMFDGGGINPRDFASFSNRPRPTRVTKPRGITSLDPTLRADRLQNITSGSSIAPTITRPPPPRPSRRFNKPNFYDLARNPRQEINPVPPPKGLSKNILKKFGKAEGGRLTLEERQKRTAARNKAAKAKREAGEKKLISGVKSVLGGAAATVAGAFGPSEQKKRNAEKRAENKAKREARLKADKAKNAQKRKENAAKVAKRKADAAKKRAAKKTSDVKKGSGVRTYKGTGYKKQTVTPSSITEKKIDRTDPATRERLIGYGKDPDTGHVGIQSLFGGKSKPSTTKKTTKTDKKTETSKNGGFPAAFRKARNDYLNDRSQAKTFLWKGKSYNINIKDKEGKSQTDAQTEKQRKKTLSGAYGNK